MTKSKSREDSPHAQAVAVLPLVDVMLRDRQEPGYIDAWAEECERLYRILSYEDDVTNGKTVAMKALELAGWYCQEIEKAKLEDRYDDITQYEYKGARKWWERYVDKREGE